MIQKRYEYWSKEGKVFSSWFDYEQDDSLLTTLEAKEKWQLQNKLRNEFRIKNNKQQL
jgi:hypothetical protein